MEGEVLLWFFNELCGLEGCSVRHEEFIDFKYRFVRTLTRRGTPSSCESCTMAILPSFCKWNSSFVCAALLIIPGFCLAQISALGV